jgi:hypothetical protein
MPNYLKAPSSNQSECVGPSCSGCAAANCYAEGGDVYKQEGSVKNSKGVHKPIVHGVGRSIQGIAVKNGEYEIAKNEARSKLEEQKIVGQSPRENLMAEGGEVEDGFEMDDDHSMGNELREAMGTEFLDALERKDRKGILDSVEAIVMSMKGE